MSLFDTTFASSRHATRYLPLTTANKCHNDLSCSAEANLDGVLYDSIAVPGTVMRPIADLNSQAANYTYMPTSPLPVPITFSTFGLFSTNGADYLNDEFSPTTLPDVDTDPDSMNDGVYGVASDRNSITYSSIAEMGRNNSMFYTAESPQPHKGSCPNKSINNPPAISSISQGKPTTSPKETHSMSTSAANTIGSHGFNHNVQLRTVSCKPKTPTACKPAYLPSTSNPIYSFPIDRGRETFTSKAHCHRLSHKNVEKQYRNRLKVKFEQLLSVLPADQLYQDDRGDSKDRRISKADVLGLARRRIMALEQERSELRAERRTVIENVGVAYGVD